MKGLIIILFLYTSSSLSAQQYADLLRKYQYGIMSLSYGNTLEMKSALKERSFSNQVAFITNSTAYNSLLVQTTIGKFKLFVDQNTSDGWVKSFSFINLSLNDSIIYFNKADNRDFIMMKAAFNKREVVCIAFFIDQFRYINVIVRQQIADNIKQGTSLSPLLTQLKSMEDDPFTSEESMAFLKSEFSNAAGISPESLASLSGENKSLATRYIEEGSKTIFLPDQLFSSPTINAYYQGNDRLTKQKINKIMEYQKKQNELYKSLEESGMAVILESYNLNKENQQY